MKKTVFYIFVLASLFALSACGSSTTSQTNSADINTYLNPVSVDYVKKQLGTDNIENEFNSMIGYKSSTVFCGMITDVLQFWFDPSSKMVNQIYFETTNERLNKDAVDNMIDELSKKFGNPNKDIVSAYGYIKYTWKNNTGIVIRDDAVTLVDIRYS